MPTNIDAYDIIISLNITKNMFSKRINHNQKH
jgi:hypothetical protein